MYLDDSGTSPSQPVAVASALIVPTAQISRLENEWTNLKRKEGFSEWHTSEFVARNHKSEFANWDEKKQERVFKRVREISKKYGARAISGSIKKQDYDEIVPSEYRRYTDLYHYTWCVAYVIALAEATMGEGLKGRQPLHPFEFYF